MLVAIKSAMVGTGRLRMARRSSAGGRLRADGRRSSACGWPEVVCVRMAGGRLLADARRSSADGPGSSADGDSPSRRCDRGQRWPGGGPLGRLLDPGLAVVLFLSNYSRRSPKRPFPQKKDVRRWRRWAGARACTNALFSQPQQLQKMLYEFKDSTEKVGLRIRPGKTKVFSNQSGHCSDTKKEMQIDDIEIEILTRSESVRYLG